MEERIAILVNKKTLSMIARTIGIEQQVQQNAGILVHLDPEHVAHFGEVRGGADPPFFRIGPGNRRAADVVQSGNELPDRPGPPAGGGPLATTTRAVIKRGN